MYVGDLLEKNTVGGVTDWRHYVKVGSRTVAVVSRKSDGTNVTRYLLEDHLGSVAQIVDASGTPYVGESFAAFGARRDAGTWSDSCLCDDLVKIKGVSRRGFTEHEAVGGVSLGLIHMNGRMQDSITGRFLSADPNIPHTNFTQSFNRYSYVNNNPLSSVDPSGFEDEMKDIVIGGLRTGPEWLTEGWRIIDPAEFWAYLVQKYFMSEPNSAPPDELEEVVVQGKMDLPQEKFSRDLKIATCKVGNWFARRSQDLGKASSVVVAGGLVVSASSALFGVTLVPGGAMIATGGVAGAGAAGTQFIAGALQFAGGADSHNMRNSLISAAGGFVINKSLFGLGRTVGGRAAEMKLDLASTQVGGAYDAFTNFLDDMAPSEASCGGN